jgi:hypothetical protein
MEEFKIREGNKVIILCTLKDLSKETGIDYENYINLAFKYKLIESHNTSNLTKDDLDYIVASVKEYQSTNPGEDGK